MKQLLLNYSGTQIGDYVAFHIPGTTHIDKVFITVLTHEAEGMFTRREN